MNGRLDMTKAKRKYGLIAIGVTAVVWFSANALAGLPYNGVVLEEGTDKPIPGAIVAVRWTGQGGLVDARTVCIKTAVVRADSEGKFSIGRSVGDLFNGRTNAEMAAYAPGYVPLRTPELLLEPITSINIEQDPERKKRLHTKEMLGREWSKKLQADRSAGVIRVEKTSDVEEKMKAFSATLGLAWCESPNSPQAYTLGETMLREFESFPRTNQLNEWIKNQRKDMAIFLVNSSRPAAYTKAGDYDNVNVNDRLKPEPIK
jgi:hypothetical protein